MSTLTTAPGETRIRIPDVGWHVYETLVSAISAQARSASPMMGGTSRSW